MNETHQRLARACEMLNAGTGFNYTPSELTEIVRGASIAAGLGHSIFDGLLAWRQREEQHAAEQAARQAMLGVRHDWTTLDDLIILTREPQPELDIAARPEPTLVRPRIANVSAETIMLAGGR